MSIKQKKIRDIERLLRKIDGKKAQGVVEKVDGDNEQQLVSREEFRNSTKRKQKIQELEELKLLREKSLIKARQRKNSVKYHLVRFIERKKVTRLICGIDSRIKAIELEGPTSNKELLKKLKFLRSQRDELEKDLIYIMYYPMEYKYISLFAKAEESKQMRECDEKDTNEDEYQYSKERNSVLSIKVRSLAEAAHQEHLARSPEEDKVQHAIEVAKRKRQRRIAGSKATSSKSHDGEEVDQENGHLSDESSIPGTKVEYGDISLTKQRRQKDNGKSSTTRSDENVNVIPAPSTSQPLKKQKREAVGKVLATETPASESAKASTAADSFFVEEMDLNGEAEDSELLRRRREEHDHLRIGDLRALRKKKYIHRNMFKKK